MQDSAQAKTQPVSIVIEPVDCLPYPHHSEPDMPCFEPDAISLPTKFGSPMADLEDRVTTTTTATMATTKPQHFLIRVDQATSKQLNTHQTPDKCQQLNTHQTPDKCLQLNAHQTPNKCLQLNTHQTPNKCLQLNTHQTPEKCLRVSGERMASQTDKCIDEEREAARGLDGGQIDLVRRLGSGESILVGDCDNRTALIERIGGGSFGDIFLGRLIENDQPVAVKVEPQSTATQYVLNEGNIYRKLEGGAGIPRIYWYGLHGSEYAMLVMDLMGSTLYEHWVNCGSKFSLKTTLMLIEQMLVTVQHMHENHIVHRDISVSNFMTGSGTQGLAQINLIDFGHAKKLATGQLLPAARRRLALPKPMVGTPRFASVFCHMGQEEGYRDDLESLAYVWIYLYKGQLPWQGQRLRPGESKLDRIAYLKLNTRLETLCEGLPEEFLFYMNYVRRLRPNQMPHHEQLRELFRNLAENMKIEYDWQFDWLVVAKGENKENGFSKFEA